MRRGSRLASVLAVALAAWPAAGAGAHNVTTLDSQATTPGSVIEDSAGTAYIAWVRKAPSSGAAETPEFCKIPRGGSCASPITLPVPAPAADTESPAAAFPVFGSGSTVYVVAPRYVADDVLLYTSTDGGASFGAAQVIKSAYPNKSDPVAAFLSGSEFLIGAYNPGIGFGAFDTTPSGLGQFALEEPGPGGVVEATMGLDTSGNPVIAYYNLSSPQYALDFIRYLGSGSKTKEADWTSAATVTNGDVPRLAGGAGGLFLVSEDYTSAGASYPARVDLRKFEGTGFGAPTTLFEDPSTELYDGGTIAESPGGHLAVVWPEFGGSSTYMRLLVSSNGGASFSAAEDVAAIGSGYGVQNNAQLAIADDGGGWLTFSDAGGLELADLTAQVTKAKEETPPPAKTTPNQSTKIGNDIVTLAGPKGCVKPGETVTVKLSVRSAKRKHKVVVKIYKVIFSLDGKVFKTEIRKKVLHTGKVDPAPYVASIKRTFTAGSTHTVSARAFIKERHGHHASKTLKVTFAACA